MNFAKWVNQFEQVCGTLWNLHGLHKNELSFWFQTVDSFILTSCIMSKTVSCYKLSVQPINNFMRALRFCHKHCYFYEMCLINIFPNNSYGKVKSNAEKHWILSCFFVIHHRLTEQCWAYVCIFTSRIAFNFISVLCNCTYSPCTLSLSF